MKPGILFLTLVLALALALQSDAKGFKHLRSATQRQQAVSSPSAEEDTSLLCSNIELFHRVIPQGDHKYKILFLASNALNTTMVKMKFLVKTKSGEQEQEQDSESSNEQEMPMRQMDSAPLVKLFGPQDEDSSIEVGKKGSLRFHFRYSVDDRICDSKSFEFSPSTPSSTQTSLTSALPLSITQPTELFSASAIMPTETVIQRQEWLRCPGVAFEPSLVLMNPDTSSTSSSSSSSDQSQSQNQDLKLVFAPMAEVNFVDAHYQVNDGEKINKKMSRVEPGLSVQGFKLHMGGGIPRPELQSRLLSKIASLPTEAASSSTESSSPISSSSSTDNLPSSSTDTSSNMQQPSASSAPPQSESQSQTDSSSSSSEENINWQPGVLYRRAQQPVGDQSEQAPNIPTVATWELPLTDIDLKDGDIIRVWFTYRATFDSPHIDCDTTPFFFSVLQARQGALARQIKGLTHMNPIFSRSDQSDQSQSESEPESESPESEQRIMRASPVEESDTKDKSKEDENVEIKPSVSVPILPPIPTDRLTPEEQVCSQMPLDIKLVLTDPESAKSGQYNVYHLVFNVTGAEVPLRWVDAHYLQTESGILNFRMRKPRTGAEEERPEPLTAKQRLVLRKLQKARQRPQAIFGRGGFGGGGFGGFGRGGLGGLGSFLGGFGRGLGGFGRGLGGFGGFGPYGGRFGRFGGYGGFGYPGYGGFYNPYNVYPQPYPVPVQPEVQYVPYPVPTPSEPRALPPLSAQPQPQQPQAEVPLRATPLPSARTAASTSTSASVPVPTASTAFTEQDVVRAQPARLFPAEPHSTQGTQWQEGTLRHQQRAIIDEPSHLPPVHPPSPPHLEHHEPEPEPDFEDQQDQDSDQEDSESDMSEGPSPFDMDMAVMEAAPNVFVHDGILLKEGDKLAAFFTFVANRSYCATPRLIFEVPQIQEKQQQQQPQQRRQERVPRLPLLTRGLLRQAVRDVIANQVTLQPNIIEILTAPKLDCEAIQFQPHIELVAPASEAAQDQDNYRIVFQAISEPRAVLWVDVHYTLNNETSRNYRMIQRADGLFEHVQPGWTEGIHMTEDDVLNFSFTFKSKAICDSQTFSTSVPSAQQDQSSSERLQQSS